MIARRAPDLWVIGLFVVLPILWLNQVLVPDLSGKSMLPFDNLYAFEPWHSVHAEVVPYNPLVLHPGETGTITVKFRPNGPAGTKVRGAIFIDTYHEDTGSGDELDAVPYRYTIGKKQTAAR